MPNLALLGGTALTQTFLQPKMPGGKSPLGRTYLLDAYESEIWDDWPDVPSQASLFQREWAEFNGVPYAALITNGTHTLQLALEALDIGFGDEVIVPAITWQATASVVCDVNAVPVLVDVDPATLCIDPACVEAAITPKTRAIIPVHLYHRMADMEAIMDIARRHELHVIEDAAHAHGSTWRDQAAGSIGTFGSFSFQRSKLMNSGEGGALIMKDKSLYLRIMSQRSCGREFEPGVKVHSGNYRITTFQAAVLRGQLAGLRENANERHKTGIAYDAAVDATPGVSSLRRSAHLTRQVSYGFAFLYQPEAFDDLPAPVFRKALTAELGAPFGTCYEPLNQSPYYYPHTKKRHQLSPEYVKAITPSRWHLPVSDDLWRNRVVQAHWPVFMPGLEQAGLLTEAIGKIFDNRNELLDAMKSGALADA